MEGWKGLEGGMDSAPIDEIKNIKLYLILLNYYILILPIHIYKTLPTLPTLPYYYINTKNK